MSVVDRLRTPRSERFVRFLGVGVIGMVVDLAITFALLPHTHYLVANSAGFLVAVSHNFVGNWWVTYRRPDGNVAWQYLSYVGLHGATFACRAIALTAVVEAAGVPPSVGTAIGVVVAAVLNFAGSETIFGGDQRIWFDIVEATNHLAHAIYSSRLRSVLVYTGLYNPVFRVYTLGLASTYRASSRAVSVRGTSAMLATEKPTETVSVLHTLEKEGDVLADFVADVQPDDRVLDVGARLVLLYNGDQSQWQAWVYNGTTRDSYLLTASAGSPTSFTNLQVNHNGSHITLARNGTQADVTATDGGVASVPDAGNLDGRLEEFRAFNRSLNDSTQSELATAPVVQQPGTNRSARSLFDQPRRDTQSILFTGARFETSNVSYSRGFAEDVMQPKTVTNDLTGSTDYVWQSTGPKIRPTSGGELDGAPAAYVSYETDVDSAVSAFTDAMNLAAVIPLLIVVVLIIRLTQQ